MEHRILEVDSVSKIYTDSGEASLKAIDSVSLHLKAGEFIAVLGPSGSGKTTLLAMIGGLLKPTSGTISVDGQQINGISARNLAGYRREKIGFVFQNYNLIPFLSALDNLLVVAHINKKLNGAAKKKAKSLLAELGLDKKTDPLPSSLSGGERQRVAIARALMNDPTLILVDEPTANLDTGRGEQVVAMLRDQVRLKGKAGIMVTHDERMCQYADRTVTLVDGKITQSEKV